MITRKVAGTWWHDDEVVDPGPKGVRFMGTYHRTLAQPLPVYAPRDGKGAEENWMVPAAVWLDERPGRSWGPRYCNNIEGGGYMACAHACAVSKYDTSAWRPDYIK